MTEPLRRRFTSALGVFALVALVSTACSAGDPEPPPPTSTTQPASPGESPGGPESPPAGNGIFDDAVLFGQSAAFSGPAQELGLNMRLGIEAAFAEANRNGGVHGRRLDLASLDDAYEPEAAVTNTQQLIETDGVFALIGEVGTPTSRSATPVAAAADVPFIAPFTGAEFLRDDGWRNIINLRSSYYQETEEIVARLIADQGVDRIAVMFQDDSFGRAGYRGVLQALDRRDMEPVAIGLYPRNTTAVRTALLDLQLGDPDAVVLVGAYQPVAALIAWARYVGEDWTFVTISFVGANALAEELGPFGDGVFVTQVVPFPDDDSLPVVASYLDALAAHDPDAAPGFVSLEGYLAGRMAIVGLERCGRDLSRTCFLNEILRGAPVDIDGFELRFGGDDNQGSDAVFLTVIRDGRYVATVSM
ncbi:MAG: ABC transporter substrate-binding protein [Acidimicrobiia bacterium]|nr:ABC transporter substrate-binding protein [Acidimicrobiia bacterium]MYC44365.1 ABC transporter substrate-binding protein [Acidimicrobiia bacterium]